MNKNSIKIIHEAFVSENYENFIQIKNLPHELIKFYNGSYSNNENRYLNTFTNNKLWLSSPNYYNDPFDCAINIDFKKNTYDHFFKWTDTLFNPKVEEVFFNNEKVIQLIDLLVEMDEMNPNEKARAFKDNIFISCFSEKSNLHSLRMWGHYANSHKGFCAEYNLVKAIKYLKKEIMPVLYSNNYSVDFKTTKSRDKLRQFFASFVYTKALEWEYEKEWRLGYFNREHAGEHGYLIPFVNADKIYLGCKIEDKLKNQLLEICKEKGIEIFQMYMEPKTYNLLYKQINI